ncbi:MAG TPA: class I SAM-dependent methyltransferase [Gemmatales bacterium]|nr:class I SAM-dependent methyltransferase [Gemmatales bacterium]
MSTTPPTSTEPAAEFDAFAGDYDAALQQGLSVSGESKEYFAQGRIQLLQKHLGRLKFFPQHVLDYGCGTGTSVPLLHQITGVEKVHGIDISAESIREAEKKYGHPQRVFSTLSSYVPAGNIDLAFCNGVFHHIPLDQRGAAVKMIYDALRPGGIFCYWENNPWNPATRYVMSRIPFDRDAITLTPPESRRLLQSAGFEIHSTNYLFIFPRMLRWLRPMEQWMTRWPVGTQYQILSRKPC